MPFNQSNRNASITENQLAPHLRNGSTGGSVYSDADIANVTTIELAEAIEAGDAIGIDANGKGIKAGTVEAIAIAGNDGNEGDICFLEFTEFESDRYDFEPGEAVWLVSAAPNLTTTFPAVFNGMIIQRIGTAVSATKLLIKIEPAGVVNI